MRTFSPLLFSEALPSRSVSTPKVECSHLFGPTIPDYRKLAQSIDKPHLQTSPQMKIYIGQMIRRELRNRERTVAWFARKICCTRPHAYKIFEKENIDLNLLIRICQILDYDFLSEIAGQLRHDNGDTSVISSDNET